MRTEGEEMDDMFEWADAQTMDILCQGITQGTPDNDELQDWYSIWSFGTEEERLMFVLRFGSVDI
jgi:hypothetical protein